MSPFKHQDKDVEAQHFSYTDKAWRGGSLKPSNRLGLWLFRADASCMESS